MAAQCCSRFGDLQALAEEWNRLVDESAYPNVFLRWEWVGTWWKWFGRGRPLCVYLVYDGSQLVGILPLYARRRTLWGVSRRMVLAPIGFGGPTCPEYLGLIVHREAIQPVVDCLVEALGCPDDPWAVLELPDVAPDDPGTTTLVQTWSSRATVLSYPGVVCPACTLPKTYNELLGRLSRHGRQRERRQLRRALDKHNAQLRIVSSGPEAEEIFPLLIALSRSSRRRQGQATPFENEDYVGFHRQVVRETSKSGILRVHVLYINDPSAERAEPQHPALSHSGHVRDGNAFAASYAYGFVYRAKYYHFQTGYNWAVSQISPGDVLRQMVLQKLIAEGIREFDYLRGEESYKYVFADRERRTMSYYLFPSVNPAYLRYFIRFRAAAPLRRCAKRMLQRLRTPRKADRKPAAKRSTAASPGGVSHETDRCPMPN